MRSTHDMMTTLLICCLLALPTTAVAAESRVQTRNLSFGVVPQQAPSKLLRSWKPVLKYLQTQTGHRFIFRTAPDIPTFEQRLQAGEYDFAYMNPYHFTVFNRGEEGYQAIAKAKDKRIQGILVVHKDSSIKTLQDLDGHHLAFPAPGAFAASVLPQIHLKNAGLMIEPEYVSSHDSVYKAVAEGFYPAGGGVIRTFKASPPDVRAQLRVLWTTPSYTPHAIAAHPRVGPELRAAVQQALAAIDSDTRAPALLERLKLKGFVVARNADWDDVRALHIDTKLGKGD